MKKLIIGLLVIITIVAVFLLGNLNSNQIEETNKKTNTVSKEITNIPSGYEDILKIIKNYELPEEGKVKIEGVLVYYENGYQFDIYSKDMVGREYMPEDGPEKPTEGQYLGVILGFIIDINYQQYWSNVENTQDIKGKLERLYEAKKYSENYEPIKNWINKTISYLEESQKLMETDNVRSEELYNKACQNIINFNKVFEISKQRYN